MTKRLTKIGVNLIFRNYLRLYMSSLLYSKQGVK